jgi:perosamine synthetase
VTTPIIPMSSPDLTRAEIEAVEAVLETPYLSLGPQLAEFEQRFAAYIGSRYAAAVSSGTAGLHLAIIATGIGQGDLVITTPFSFIASANCILYERAIPVFVDIEPDSLNIDPDQVATAAQEIERGGPTSERWLPPNLRQRNWSRGNGRLKAILPIHAFGQPADMDSIRAVAQRHELTIIEDACEAIGAQYKGRQAGTLGDVAVFAFYPNKQMTTGEGGMIVTNNEGWANLFYSLRNQGRDVFNAWLDHSRLGYNYRLDELSAALGLAQLIRIEELLAKRARVAGWYNDRLKIIPGVETPRLTPTTSHISWFVYVIRLALDIDRDTVMMRLTERGIPSRPYFSPIHLQTFYRQRFGYQVGDFPVTEKIARSTLALPFFNNMSEDQVEKVCLTLQEVMP